MLLVVFLQRFVPVYARQGQSDLGLTLPGTHAPRDSRSPGFTLPGTHAPGTHAPRDSRSPGVMLPGTHAPLDSRSPGLTLPVLTLPGTHAPRDSRSPGLTLRGTSHADISYTPEDCKEFLGLTSLILCVVVDFCLCRHL